MSEHILPDIAGRSSTKWEAMQTRLPMGNVPHRRSLLPWQSRYFAYHQSVQSHVKCVTDGSNPLQWHGVRRITLDVSLYWKVRRLVVSISRAV
jgi:hypothetical protein